MESHTLISRELIPRQLALQYFQTLLKTDAEELQVAIDWIETATITLSLEDSARDLRNFAKDKQVEIAYPESLLEALFSLEGLRCSLEWTGQAVLQLLLEDAKTGKSIPKDFDEGKFRKSLGRFFGNSAKLERTLKAQRVYDGFLPNYESCSSLVDFRPIYEEKREQIINGIIAATMSISVRDVDGELLTNTYSFQLDAKDIDDMLEELSRLKTKLKALKNLAEGQVKLLNPSRSLKIDSTDGRKK